LGFAVFFTLKERERKKEKTEKHKHERVAKEKTVCSRTEPKDLLFTSSSEDPNLLLLPPLLGSALFGLSSIIARQLLHGSILILALVFPAGKEKGSSFPRKLEYPFADFAFFGFTNSNFAQLSGDICWVVEGREGSRLALLWFVRIGFFVCFQSENCLTSCEFSSLFQFLHAFLLIIVVINLGEEGGLFLLGCVWWCLFLPVFCSTILYEKFV